MIHRIGCPLLTLDWFKRPFEACLQVCLLNQFKPVGTSLLVYRSWLQPRGKSLLINLVHLSLQNSFVHLEISKKPHWLNRNLVRHLWSDLLLGSNFFHRFWCQAVEYSFEVIWTKLSWSEPMKLDPISLFKKRCSAIFVFAYKQVKQEIIQVIRYLFLCVNWNIWTKFWNRL